jgi:DNA repair exonuclease SbcCD nuclease subunit
MRILVSGDKHLGLVSDGMERLEEQARILQRTVDLLRAECPAVFVDLGDLFHTPRPGPAAYTVAFEYLCNLVAWAEETEGRAFLMTGNHDKPTRGRAHALRPLGQVIAYACGYDGGVRLIDEPEVVSYRGFELLFLPHVTDWEARETDADIDAGAYLDEFAADALADAEGRSVIAFTHLEVPGARMSNDETVQRDTGLRIPRDVLEAENVLRVYAGHVHKFQELDRVTVVGSSIYVDFGEAADPKGIVSANVRLE